MGQDLTPLLPHIAPSAEAQTVEDFQQVAEEEAEWNRYTLESYNSHMLPEILDSLSQKNNVGVAGFLFTNVRKDKN